MLLSILILGATTGLAMEKKPGNLLFSLGQYHWYTRLNSRSSFLNSLINEYSKGDDNIKIIRFNKTKKGSLNIADYSYSVQEERTYTHEGTIEDLKKYLKENLKKLTSETLITFCEENKEKNPYKNFLQETRFGNAVFCSKNQTIIYPGSQSSINIGLCDEYEDLTGVYS
jgi:hypothetical protein